LAAESFISRLFRFTRFSCFSRSWRVFFASRSSLPAEDLDLEGDDDGGAVTVTDGALAGDVGVLNSLPFVDVVSDAADAAAAAAANSQQGSEDSLDTESLLFDFREKDGPLRFDCSGAKPLKQRL